MPFSDKSIDELLGEIGQVRVHTRYVVPESRIPAELRDRLEQLDGPDASALVYPFEREMLRQFHDAGGMNSYIAPERGRPAANIDELALLLYGLGVWTQIQEAFLNAMEYGAGDVRADLYDGERGFACIIDDQGEGFDVGAMCAGRLKHRGGGGRIVSNNFRGTVAFNEKGNRVIIQYLS